MLLPDVLTSADLPAAELCALRLDGAVFESGEGFAPVDSVDGPLLRAQSLAPLLAAPRIADRATAAWVWGAAPVLRRPIEACVRPGLSQGIEPLRGVQVRESTLRGTATGAGSGKDGGNDGDVVELGGLEITSPRRTVLDLVRLPPAPTVDAWIALLLEGAGIGLDDLLADLADSRFQRERRRAREQLIRLAA